MYHYPLVTGAVLREQTINSGSVSKRDPAYAQATLPALHTSSDKSLESSLRRDLTIATVSRDTSEVFERRGMTKIKIVLSASLHLTPFVSIHPMEKFIWGSEQRCMLKSEFVSIKKEKKNTFILWVFLFGGSLYSGTKCTCRKTFSSVSLTAFEHRVKVRNVYGRIKSHAVKIYKNCHVKLFFFFLKKGKGKKGYPLKNLKMNKKKKATSEV